MFKIKFSKMRRDLILKSVENQECDNCVFFMNLVNPRERPSVRIKEYKGVRTILVDFDKPIEFKPLIPKLRFITNKKRWSGHLMGKAMREIPEEDFKLIFEGR